MSSETSIIWDWNGTLLNDVDIALKTMNILLKRYNCQPLTKTRYKEIFQFPVENYYIYAGLSFDDIPFSELAEEFIEIYYDLLPNSSLFEGVKAIVSQFQARGYRQYVLSAMEQSALELSIKKNNIFKYFDGIYGITDILGRSKLSRGQQLFFVENLHLDCSIIIGDTIHDHHIASQIGCDHLLVAQGHQNYSRLRGISSNVLQDISCIPDFLFRFYPKRSLLSSIGTLTTN